MMEFSIDHFESLPPRKKLEFLKSEEFEKIKEKEPFINSSLKEAYPPLKAYALKLAGKMKLKDEEFFSQFLSEPNPVVIDSARKAIELIKKEIRDEKNLKEEAERILQIGEKIEKINFIEKIKSLKEKWVAEILLEFLEDPSWDVRNYAVKAISDRDDIEVQSFLDLLKKPQWFVKGCVLEIMGNRKMAVISKEVVELKRDSNIEVKLKLIEFFSKIGGEEVIQHLTELSSDSHSWIRKAAHKALQELKRNAISLLFVKK
ncbi:MAG: HEAT repeat domain-containing protein [Candidatus Aminicenantia bacterium]